MGKHYSFGFAGGAGGIEEGGEGVFFLLGWGEGAFASFGEDLGIVEDGEGVLGVWFFVGEEDDEMDGEVLEAIAEFF